jgi:hypothetical protein
VEIVNQVAAAQNQDAALAHFLQLPAKRKMFGEGTRLIQTHLKDRNIRLWVHVAEHAPRAVIQPPLLIGGKMMLERQALRFFRRAGSRYCTS